MEKPLFAPDALFFRQKRIWQIAARNVYYYNTIPAALPTTSKWRVKSITRLPFEQHPAKLNSATVAWSRREASNHTGGSRSRRWDTDFLPIPVTLCMKTFFVFPEDCFHSSLWLRALFTMNENTIRGDWKKSPRIPEIRFTNTQNPHLENLICYFREVNDLFSRTKQAFFANQVRFLPQRSMLFTQIPHFYSKDPPYYLYSPPLPDTKTLFSEP